MRRLSANTNARRPFAVAAGLLLVAVVAAAPAEAMIDALARPAGAVGLYQGLIDEVQRLQAYLNRELTVGVRGVKEGASLAAIWSLATVGFLYGVFHAAGPGHGKAIVSSYVLANNETMRRGIGMAILAALFQALTAIALVGLLSLVLGWTGRAVGKFGDRLEQLSYLLIAAFGAYLLAAQIAKLWRRSNAVHAHTHAHHGHGHHHHHDHDHPHHVHDEHCGHTHLPEPTQLAGTWSWTRAVAMAALIGLRPCSGAILILIFALSQGILWAGIGATFAMALGTALTVSALAFLAVGSRDLAARFSGASGVWARRIEVVTGIGGAALVLVLGLLFFIASLTPRSPF